MTNGITWEEELLTRIREARDKQTQAQEAIRQVKSDVKYWDEYATALERAMQLYREKQGIKINGHQTLDAERLRTQSTWANLVDIISANNGLLVVIEATTALVDAGVFRDREHARNVIYSTLNSHKRDVERVRQGVYQLRNRSDIKKKTTTKRSPNPQKQRGNSGLRQVVKDLKEANPQITMKEVLNHLLKTGFDFKGKKPGNAVNMVWVYWGYSKEGKQQSLLGIH